MLPEGYDMMLHMNVEENGTVVEFSDTVRRKLTDYLKSQERKNGYTPREYYDDDYLFLYYCLNKAYECYFKMNIHPITGVFMNACKNVPYIHLETTEEAKFEYDETGAMVPSDKTLNAGVEKTEDGRYVLYINRYYLIRLLTFLQRMFDKNEEQVVTIDGECISEDGSKFDSSLHFKSVPLVSKNDVLTCGGQIRATRGLENQGDEIIRYALSLDDEAKVTMPGIAFYRDSESGKTLSINVIYTDKDRECFTVQLRKPIYNAKAFAKWFERRNALIDRLFGLILETILSHEFAHVANGHCDLIKVEPFFCSQREIAMCAEENADDTTMRWRICELLYDTADGNPQNYLLSRTREELKEEWMLRIFAAYLSLTWIYRDETRGWNEQTMEIFHNKEQKEGRTAKHPTYHFRAFNMINRSIKHLEIIAAEKTTSEFKTSDGRGIDERLIQETKDGALAMIESFEKYFRKTYMDERGTVEKLRETVLVDEQSCPDDIKKLPFVLQIALDQAGKEAAEIVGVWPLLKKHLEENGTYCKLYGEIG